MRRALHEMLPFSCSSSHTLRMKPSSDSVCGLHTVELGWMMLSYLSADTERIGRADLYFASHHGLS